MASSQVKNMSEEKNYPKVLLELGNTGLSNLRCELVSGSDISFLLGKMKTFIDSLGLPDKQEKATKDIVQTILWDWFNFIVEHNTDHLIEKRQWYQIGRASCRERV